MATAQNVIATAASKPYVSKVLNWQVINNELMVGGDCGSTPVFDPTQQHGFWAVQPNGTLSIYGTYLQGLIDGSIPLPSL